MIVWCIVLTIDNLSRLQVLFEELHAAIDTALDLVISAYLYGDIVPELKLATVNYMYAKHHSGSEKSSIRLTVQRQPTLRGSNHRPIQRWERLV